MANPNLLQVAADAANLAVQSHMRGLPPIQAAPIGAPPHAGMPPVGQGGHPMPAGPPPTVGAIPWRAVLPYAEQIGRVAAEAALQAAAASIGPEGTILLNFLKSRLHLFQDESGAPRNIGATLDKMGEFVELGYAGSGQGAAPQQAAPRPDDGVRNVPDMPPSTAAPSVPPKNPK